MMKRPLVLLAFMLATFASMPSQAAGPSPQPKHAAPPSGNVPNAILQSRPQVPIKLKSADNDKKKKKRVSQQPYVAY